MRGMSMVLSAALVWASFPAMAQQTTAPAASPKSMPTNADSGADAARMEVARKLVSVMRLEDTLDKMFVSLAPVTAQGMIGAMQSDPAAKAPLDMLISQGEGGQDRLVAILSEEFLAALRAQYPAFLEQTAKEYAAVLTTEELQQIVVFYQTGAGAKMLQLTPELQNKMAKFGAEIGAVAGVEAATKGFERASEEMLPKNGNTKS